MDHNFLVTNLSMFLGSLGADFDNAVYKQAKSNKKACLKSEYQSLDKEYLFSVLLNRTQMLLKSDVDLAMSLVRKSISRLFDVNSMRPELVLLLDKLELLGGSEFFEEVLEHAIKSEFKF